MVIRETMKDGDIVVFRRGYAPGHGVALLTRDAPHHFSDGRESRIHWKRVVAVTRDRARADAAIARLDLEERLHQRRYRDEEARHRAELRAIIEDLSAGDAAGIHPSAA